jgi:RNA polymerase sigma-70 factor (ECF subfamily)
MLTDTELVGRARVGDVQAFGELVRRHHRMLYRTALAMLRSAEDAEDVTQTTWLQAYRNVRHFQGTASVSTWLMAIVRHQAMNHQRSRQNRIRREVSHLPPDAFRREERISQWPSPEDLVLLNERRAHVARSVEALSTPLRRALRLWSTGRYSYQEMAQITGVATGTVKSRVWEARRRLRASPVVAERTSEDLRRRRHSRTCD